MTAVSFALVVASCTNPGPAGGYTLTIKATDITNTSFNGDWPLTFWDNDAAEEPYLVHMGLRIGLDRFGASAPAPDLYKHFGLTADAIIPKIVEKLNR